jgi:hypothetical protein
MWRAVARGRSEVQRPVHGRDEEREKKDDKSDPKGHPSEFFHLMQGHIVSSLFSRDSIAMGFATRRAAVGDNF